MQVALKDAQDLADRYEALLESKGISIGAHPSTGADMLPLWKILEMLRKGFVGTPDDLQAEYSAGIAVHDLAAKILAVAANPQFGDLVPHMEMLNGGAIHMTTTPPANADVYNKLIEAYWAALLMSRGTQVRLDHPKNSKGDNPDAIACDGDEPARAYAFKTIRSSHTQSLLDHLKKGVDQIEKSPAAEGVVVFHLTPRLLQAGLWPPAGKFFDNLTSPINQGLRALDAMFDKLLSENGQAALDAVFAGKKTAGTVLSIAMYPTVARNPVSGNAVVMPIKIVRKHELSDLNPLSPALSSEIEAAHEVMQRELG